MILRCFSGGEFVRTVDILVFFPFSLRFPLLWSSNDVMISQEHLVRGMPGVAPSQKRRAACGGVAHLAKGAAKRHATIASQILKLEQLVVDSRHAFWTAQRETSLSSGPKACRLSE